MKFKSVIQWLWFVYLGAKEDFNILSNRKSCQNLKKGLAGKVKSVRTYESRVCVFDGKYCTGSEIPLHPQDGRNHADLSAISSSIVSVGKCLH
jgi:hypothetical protein